MSGPGTAERRARARPGSRGRRLGDDDLAFAATVAHELRMPLATVAIAVATAAEHPDRLDAVQMQRVLTSAARHTRRALALLDRLERTWRAADGSLQLEAKDVDLTRLVDVLVADLSVWLLDGRVTVHTNGYAHVPVVGDETAIGEVITNLLANAAKYSDEGSGIDVTLDLHGGSVDVVVRDRGIGVPIADHERIFQRHSQLDAGYAGAGLGLYVSRALAREHGGDVLVRPADGVGTEFVLRLPVVAP